MGDVFAGLRARIAELSPVSVIGRVAGLGQGTLAVTGMTETARLGDRVSMGRGRVEGEVIAIDPAGATILPEAPPEGLAIGDAVRLIGPARLAPHDGWIGRIIDPLGRPLDGRPLLPGAHPRALHAPPPPPARRRRLGPRLATGVAVFDTLLPLVRGQRLGLFSGSGVGKSSLLAQFARGVDADVVVLGLVGERGRELRAFTEEVLGSQGMARAVVVAATSDQSPLLRRRCALAAMAVAEHFRDGGRHVLLLVDSVTRFAEAHREVALAAGEGAAMRGWPASTAQAIMGLSERAGPGAEDAGDITAVLTVLVAGSDMEEPVADILRGVLDGHVVLDRAIAERGRYPAVDLLRSVSRSLPAAANVAENALITRARQLLGAWDRAETMIQAGLYTRGSDPLVDEAMAVWPALDAFLAEAAPGGTEASFARLADCLRQPWPPGDVPTPQPEA
ncbi:MAG TPA: FliI/YscN family ATPase [Paracoccaceae bacterium]|nr:FliI/YscN family ATPase [Paracoccaceae bacterium]